MTRPRSPKNQRAFAHLPTLYASGLSPAALASTFGVSDETIYRWLDEHGLPRRRHPVYTAPTVRRAVEAVANGESMASVARRTGASPATVHHWCARAGVRFQRQVCLPRRAHPVPGTTSAPERT